MAEAGASVYINARVKDVLDSRCQELCDLGYDAKSALFDATDFVAVERFLSSIAPKAFSEVVEANLNSAYAILRSFSSRFDKKDIKGSLINITSIAGP